ncbi:Mtf2p KNAG_0K01840 [Huiozyma naganishii CBS 8797]|uniref:Mtf2-like C-terminal domain-containing protein n=1 Tax=Huiozyma naganishii (strain ATCC MYA-139 / BCRC 22969 / CBS 8797 / KCTC 17520 / NBRC 10181 / NCYC 3082 / Yp74L-3) TaxID=1071383 RepID=J7RRR6_HUIN7|nr:hypothetical protein KNAG_0K01840 [Kazachstania naganishii CBS 8797]CCK72548.1 hypothetical protein KNAG_0K01840 [Kazachstania naganishii CBS 8797]
MLKDAEMRNSVTSFSGPGMLPLRSVQHRCCHARLFHWSARWAKNEPFSSDIHGDTRGDGPSFRSKVAQTPATQSDETIQERAMFDKLFANMQEKQERESLRRREPRDSLNLKVSFGKYDLDKTEQQQPPRQPPQRQRFTDANVVLQLERLKAGVRSCRPGIGAGPGSGPEHLCVQYAQRNGRRAGTVAGKQKRKTLDRVDGASGSALEQTAPLPEISKDLHIDLQKVEAEERFKAELTQAMRPYMESPVFLERIRTDYDATVYVRDAMENFERRDKSLDKAVSTMSPRGSPPASTFRSRANPGDAAVPEPQPVTLPYTICHLLRQTQAWSSARRYTLAMCVYEFCRRSADVSSYLYLCDVDFYNCLLELTWDNYPEAHRIAQLTAEMQTNGVRGDIYTVGILDKIVHEMRSINDDIIDEDNWQQMKNRALTVGVIWNKETSSDLLIVENYLRHLKRQLTS